MTTMLTEATQSPETAPAPSRRRSRPRTSDAAARRSRQPKLEGDALVANLAEMVDQLIKENRELKKALARAESGASGGSLGQSARILAGLQRRVYRSLTADTASSRRRSSSSAETAPAPRPRRKVTDPEVLERRRQALAKARAARAAKRQANASEQQG